MVELLQELHLPKDVCDVGLRLAHNGFACCLAVCSTIYSKTNGGVRSTVDPFEPLGSARIQGRQ
jgi:hypothetical protein